MPSTHAASPGGFQLDRLENRVLLDASGASSVVFESGAAIAAVLTADFDGDGDDDVVVATAGTGPRRIALLLNDGDGNFAPARFRRSATPITSFLTADLDGDGVPELLAAGPGKMSGRSKLAVFSLDEQTNRFRPAGMARFGTGPGIGTLHYADAPDLLLFSDHVPFTADSLVRTYSFENGQLVLRRDLGQIPSPSITDVDGDGTSELLIMRLSEETPGESTIEIAAQSAPGEFETFTIVPVPLVDFEQLVLFEDVDLDGAPDLLIAGSHEIKLHRGDGAGGFHLPEVLLESTHFYGNSVGSARFVRGPSGAFEIQMTWPENPAPGPSQPSRTPVLRFVLNDDRSFTYRRSTLDASLASDLTGEGLPEYFDVKGNILRMYRFDNQSPHVYLENVRAFRGRNLAVQIVTTGDYVRHRAGVMDPTYLVGEGPRSFRHVRFYLDTNHNGVIDPGDVLSSIGGRDVMVEAHWPRGTFSVLAHVLLKDGTFTPAVCAEQQLVIM